MSALLSLEDFRHVVKCAPLVALDLVVRDEQGEILVGLRRNAPAAGFWFVPGGRILKDETLIDAFARITQAELGVAIALENTRLLGVYEHFYADSFADPAVSTHYVVIAREFTVRRAELRLPQAVQHDDYRWGRPEALLADESVHANSRAYCVARGCEA